MNMKQIKNSVNKSKRSFWSDINETTSAQFSGGSINPGEPSPIDGLGRPIKRELVVALVLLFSNPFVR
jgi:hypothetical protein